MIFQSANKGLRLVMEAGRKEVDKSTGTPVLVIHPQREIHFKTWRYQTDKEEEIVFLKKHARFSELAGLPDTFWVFIPPRDYAAELAVKDAEIAALKAQVGTPVAASVSTTATAPVKITKKRFCEQCDSKGTYHKKDCPTKQPDLVVAPEGTTVSPPGL